MIDSRREFDLFWYSTWNSFPRKRQSSLLGWSHFVQKRSQRSSLLLGGIELIQFLAAIANLCQDDLKNRLICTRTSWWLGCKSAYSSTRPGEIKIAIPRQGIEAILYPKKQRQPLPSLAWRFILYSICSANCCRSGPGSWLEPETGHYTANP